MPRCLSVCNCHRGQEMDTKAEKLRDEAWHYRDLRLRITDESAQRALAQLIAEKEEQLLELEKELPQR